MEDLLECSVCMDRYTLDDDKIPRVFLCEHTFCHSCIKNLVKRGGSITCPTCRHKFKCSNVSLLPRNLTLLQLIEAGYGNLLPEPPRNPRRCGECWGNKAFCEKCTVAGDEAKCKSCLKKKIWGQVFELQKLLTKGKESCEQIPELIKNHLTKSISEINTRALSKYEYWQEVNELSNAFLETINKNHEQDAASRHDAVSRFHTFHKKATQKLQAIRNNLKRNMITCSTGGVLTTLSNECATHLHRLKETRDLMLHRQRNTMDISEKISKQQDRWSVAQPCNEEKKQREERVWEKIRDRLVALSALSMAVAILLIAWIINVYMLYWAYWTFWKIESLTNIYAAIGITVAFVSLLLDGLAEEHRRIYPNRRRYFISGRDRPNSARRNVVYVVTWLE